MTTCYIVFTAEVQTIQSAKLRSALTDAHNAGCDEIHLFISSPGGLVSEGLSLAAFIKSLPATVVNVIFAAGDLRVASDNASFLFHGVTMTLGQHMIESQIFETYKNIQRLREAIAQDFSLYTGVALEEVNALMGASGGEILSATQALSKGIIHEIRSPQIPEGTQIISIGDA